MKKISCIMAIILMVLAASCNKNLETTYGLQETKLESIVESLMKSGEDATVDYLDGVTRVTVAHGEGEALKDKGAVSFYYVGYYVNSTSLSQSNIFATNNEDFAKSIRWDITDSTLFEIKTLDLSKESVVSGLQKGIIGVKSGDECYVLFNGRHGFGKHATGKVPPNSALAYHLWIKGVSN